MRVDLENPVKADLLVLLYHMSKKHVDITDPITVYD